MVGVNGAVNTRERFLEVLAFNGEAFAQDSGYWGERVVNSAGIAPRERRDILEASEEIFDEVLSTNLKCPYFLTHRAARRMAEQGDGRIVFVTSISAHRRRSTAASTASRKPGSGV